MFTQDSYPHPGVEFPRCGPVQKSSGPRLVLCFGEAFTKVGLAGDTWCQLLKATPFFLTEILCSTLLVGWLQMFSNQMLVFYGCWWPWTTFFMNACDDPHIQIKEISSMPSMPLKFSVICSCTLIFWCLSHHFKFSDLKLETTYIVPSNTTLSGLVDSFCGSIIFHHIISYNIISDHIPAIS